MKQTNNYLGRLGGFIIYMLTALPLTLFFLTKSNTYYDLYSETGQMSILAIAEQYRWDAIFSIFMPAFVLIPIYNLVYFIISTKNMKQLFLLFSILLGCIFSGFLLFISTRNSPTSSDVQIVEWVAFLIMIGYNALYSSKLHKLHSSMQRDTQ